MPKREFIGILTALGLAAQLANGQLEPDCNPLHADCPAKKAWPKENYFIDFTKQTGPPENWIIANYENINFTPKGAEFPYEKKGDAPNMWTDFYILGGRYDVEMQIAPGQGVISSAVLWSDTQDEIDWEFSGNQFGEKPFPPPDGKWTVETNIFAQGKMWDGAATYQKDTYKPTEQFHTYSVEWDEDHMNWYVDNKVVRSVLAKNTPSGFIFPQSPMKLQLGVWGGGDPDNNYWTIQWAGGEIDMKGVPYSMYVKSVNITNKYPACQYKFKDKTGKIDSIEKITEGCGPSFTSSTTKATGPAKIVKNENYPMIPPSSAADGSSSSPALSSIESSAVISPTSSIASLNTYPVAGESSESLSSLTSSEPSVSSAVGESSSVPASSFISQSASSSTQVSGAATSSGYAMSSPVSSGYPVSSPGTSGYSMNPPTTTGYATSSLTTTGSSGSLLASGGFAMSSLSSSGGILSSLSSYLLGSSSAAATTSSVTSLSSSSLANSSAISASGYPTTLLTASGSTSSSASSSNASGSNPAYPSSSILATISGTGSSASFSTNASVALPSGTITPSGKINKTTGVVSSTISTVYSTNIYTVTSCAPTVTNCPTGQVTTELISISTTICPVTEAEASTPVASSTVDPTGSIAQSSLSSPISNVSSSLSSVVVSGSSYLSSTISAVSSSLKNLTSSAPQSQTMPTTYSVSSEITTSTVSTVYSTNVVTITSCAPTVTNCPVGQVTTETVSLYTTVCPVTQTVLDGTTFGGVQAIENPPPTSYPVSQNASQPALTGSVTLSSSSSSAPTTAIPSVGTSSSLLSSSVLFENTTVPSSGSLSVAPTLTAVNSSTQASVTPTQLTTSTVYSTNIYTVTSCAPDVTNCPAKLGQVTTELVSLYTTVCPVTELAASPSTSAAALPVSSETTPTQIASSSAPFINSTTQSPVLITSTVYTSSVYTISSCEIGAIECSSKMGSVTTELVALYTTVCPVTENSTALPGPTTSTVTSPTSSSVLGESTALSVSGSSVPSPIESSSTSVAPSYTTSTVYSTNIYTVTSCAPDVTNCPGKIGAVTTEVVAVSTTVCPVSAESTPAPEFTVPPVVGGAQYTTASVTLSNTFSNSVIVVTSVITFVDTPAPTSYSPTETGTANTAGTAPESTGLYPNSTRPGTTVTLGNYFTTTIEYASITQGTPASVSTTGLLATSYYTQSSAPADVPSYQMSEASSTVEMASSAPAAVIGSSTSIIATSQADAASQPEPSSSDGVTTLTSSVTNTRTVYKSLSKLPGQTGVAGGAGAVASTCACEPSAVYVTVTVTETAAQTTVTRTVEPPFPSSYGTGTVAVPLGTGASSSPTSSDDTSTTTAERRWFRKNHEGYRRGHHGGHHH